MAENVASSVKETYKAGTEQKSWRELGWYRYAKILIIGVLFCYLFHREIQDIVHSWIEDSSWSHGWLIPLFSLYFINQHKTEILNSVENTEFKPNYLGLFFMLCGIIFYPLNVVHFQYGYLRPIGMIATLGAVILFLGGWRLLKYAWLPVAFLVFAVPLPQRIFVAATMPMRFLAAQAAAFLLNLVNGLDATASGAVIDVVYKGHRLEPGLDVAEACSGMRLLMAFLALGVAMAYLHKRPIWQRIALLISTIPIAILCNIVRVTITGFIYVVIGPEYAQGFYHDMLGLLMLPLAFALYWAFAWFMSSLFVEEHVAIRREDVIVRKRNI